MNGLFIVEAVLKTLGFVAILAGGVLALLETGQAAEGDRFRAWLINRWKGIGATGWRGVLKRQTSWMLSVFNGLIGKYFVAADKSNLFNALFIGLMFLLIPVAALVNVMVGGSPRLLLFYLSMGAALALINFTGEIRKLPLINGLLSLYLGLGLFIVAPAYVFHSFTDRVLKEVTGHAALESMPVAILCYFTAYSMMHYFDTLFAGRGVESGRSPSTRAAHAFLAALPVVFVLTFFALLAGHFAVSVVPHRSWTLLISSMVFGSASLPLTLSILSAGLNARRPMALAAALILGVGTAAALSWALLYCGYAGSKAGLTAAAAADVLLAKAPGGTQVYLGPDFWVMHLPFLPILLFIGAICVGWLAKTVLAVFQGFSGKDSPIATPYRLSGVLCVALGLLMMGLGFLM